jgi:excisionase family DNA binding protein
MIVPQNAYQTSDQLVLQALVMGIDRLERELRLSGVQLPAKVAEARDEIRAVQTPVQTIRFTRKMGSVKDAAKRLDKSHGYVCRLLRKGVLVGVRGSGTTWLVDENSVDEYLQKRVA